MKSQAFELPDALIRCIPFYVVTKCDIKPFSIDLMLLIIPRFSILSIPFMPPFTKGRMCITAVFCSHLLQEASWCFVISLLCSLPSTSVVLGKQAMVAGMLLRYTWETMWKE